MTTTRFAISVTTALLFVGAGCEKERGGAVKDDTEWVFVGETNHWVDKTRFTDITQLVSRADFLQAAKRGPVTANLKAKPCDVLPKKPHTNLVSLKIEFRTLISADIDCIHAAGVSHLVLDPTTTIAEADWPRLLAGLKGFAAPIWHSSRRIPASAFAGQSASSLETLVFYGTTLEPDLAKEISSLPDLRHLDLSFSNTKAAALALVAKSPTLRSLALGTKPEHFAALDDSRVESLVVDAIAYDKDLPRLKGMKSLRHLDVAQTNITRAAAETFLRQSPALKTVIVRDPKAIRRVIELRRRGDTIEQKSRPRSEFNYRVGKQVRVVRACAPYRMGDLPHWLRAADHQTRIGQRRDK